METVITKDEVQVRVEILQRVQGVVEKLPGISTAGIIRELSPYCRHSAISGAINNLHYMGKIKPNGRRGKYFTWEEVLNKDAQNRLHTQQKQKLADELVSRIKTDIPELSGYIISELS